eukprot:scaffold104_cov375-Prasinococcus_capsulatus_cf.AAC.10
MPHECHHQQPTWSDTLTRRRAMKPAPGFGGPNELFTSTDESSLMMTRTVTARVPDLIGSGAPRNFVTHSERARQQAKLRLWRCGVRDGPAWRLSCMGPA